MRPVAAPEDDDVIANACESKPYNIARNVSLRDAFWVKGQPYSMLDMLAHDERAPLFARGTVYQAFLSALSYHLWHAPISGRIVRAFVKPGTYYSEPLFEGVGDPANRTDGGTIDVKNQISAQVYLTAVATRAVIFIEADNPRIGLVAFLGVGLAEVSTCEISVRERAACQEGRRDWHVPLWGLVPLRVVQEGRERAGVP